MKKIFVILLSVSLILLMGCQAYEKNYVPNSNIEYQMIGDDTIAFSDYYIDIANEYYQISNYNKIELYRYNDSAIVVFDFNDQASYQDFNGAAQFFNTLFIVGHGSPTVSIGKMSGFFKKVYDDDYEFWNDAYFTCNVNDQVVYQSYYKMNDSNKLILKNENTVLDYSDLFQIKKSKLERFENLSALDNIGDCNYYRNAIGSTLYIEIFNNKRLDDETFKEMTDTVENAFTNFDEELMYYYNASYPKIIVNFKDKVGIYYEKTYISNLIDGFNVVE